MTDFLTDLFASIGPRDVILVAVMMVGLYLVGSILKLARIQPRRKAPRSRQPDFSAALYGEPIIPQGPRESLPDAPMAPQDGDEESSPEFSAYLHNSNVAAALHQSRREAQTLKDEVQRLREEVEMLKASQNVSPLYGEALSLAQQGIDAAGIAGRCGISIAEAELVRSLARTPPDSRTSSLSEDDYERDDPTNRRF